MRLRRDGSQVVLSVVASLLRDAAGGVTAVAAICRDVTEARAREDELQRHHDELEQHDRQMRALAARLNDVREEERTRVSREVHDVLGQLLSSLKLHLRWIGRRVEGPPLQQRLREAEGLLDETVRAVQRIAVELRPSALDSLGLPAALRDEVRRFADRAGIAAEVEVPPSGSPAPEVGTALFRILQELLTNVARHSGAERVRVALAEANGGWTLDVTDDGVGLSTVHAPGRVPLGLLGMRERAAALGGSVRLTAGPAGGVRAYVHIPAGAPA